MLLRIAKVMNVTVIACAAVSWLLLFLGYRNYSDTAATIIVVVALVAWPFLIAHIIRENRRHRIESEAREAAYWASDDCLPIAEEIEEEPIPPILSI